MEELLAEENPYLWKYLSYQEPTPPEFEENKVFLMIRESVKENLELVHTRTKLGKEWKRGWDDINKPKDEKKM